MAVNTNEKLQIKIESQLKKPNKLDDFIAFILSFLSPKQLEELNEPRQNLTAIASKSDRQI